MTDPRRPTHGWTSRGHAVHGRTLDHLPVRTAYQRLNKRVAVKVTGIVGSMTCAWVFCLIALSSLPATLCIVSPSLKSVFPPFLIKASLIALIAWIAQTFIQLVLLSVIMVGQDVQSRASDARSAKTFEDVSEIMDVLDLNTEGGLTKVLAAVEALSEKTGTGESKLEGR